MVASVRSSARAAVVGLIPRYERLWPISSVARRPCADASAERKAPIELAAAAASARRRLTTPPSNGARAALTERRPIMTSSGGDNRAKISVLVLGQRDDPSLRVLEGGALPDGVRLLGVFDAPEKVSDDDAAAAECVFCALSGQPGATLPKLYPRLRNVRWVHSQLTGVDSLLFPALVEDEGVQLTNAKGVYTNALVEYAMLAMLYFSKDVPRLRRNQRQRKWDAFFVNEIAKQTLGVVGYGEIGKSCARRAKEAFGMRVLATRRRVSDDDVADEVFASDQMHEMLAQCDYVLCTAPLTPSTRHLFNLEAFKAMKSSGIFINIGRGPVCEEAALVRALKDGEIGGAGMDVFEREPLPEDSQLWAMDNVLLSSHNVDLTENCRSDSTELFVKLLEDRIAGKSLDKFVCDKRSGY